MPNPTKNSNPIKTPLDVVCYGMLFIPVGAAAGGIFGTLGKWGLSIFNSKPNSFADIAHFAKLGAIAAPLTILPDLLSNYLLDHNSFLEQHPQLKELSKESIRLLFYLNAVVISARLLNEPIGTTVVETMVIPLSVSLLKGLISSLKSAQTDSSEVPTPKL